MITNKDAEQLQAIIPDILCKLLLFLDFVKQACWTFNPQVNGVDVSQCSHEEAVTRFLEAQEPIIVEVKQWGSAKETKEQTQGQEEEVEEDKDVRSDEGLPIYFKHKVNYEKDN